MDADFSDPTDPSSGHTSDAVVVAKTVEGRTISRSVALAVVLGLAIIAFLGGQYLGQNRTGESVTTSGSEQGAVERSLDRATTAESASTPAPDPTPQTQPVSAALDETEPAKTETSEPAPASDEAGPAGVPDQVLSGSAEGAGADPLDVDRLRFAPFIEPTVLLESPTDPEFGNSVGFDVGSYTSDEVGALKINLRVTGSAGSVVAVHKGDRPDQAMRFVIPPNGVLVVPHLIAAVDDLGRIVISADSDVDIEAVGLGSYIRAERSQAGRFVSMGSERIASLVTAVEGRDLVIDLHQVPGVKPAEVGQVILRLNANVGTSGGTVTVVNRGAALAAQGHIASPAVMWPAPPAANLGLGGTALVMASPDAAGQVTLNYLGGSVLTADLVGYYTSVAAPTSASGLLVLNPPVREELIPDRPDLPLTTVAPGEVLVLTTSNGPVGGPVALAVVPGLADARPTFNIAPNQIRTSTVWVDTDPDGSTYLSAPPGALVGLWHVGTFTN